MTAIVPFDGNPDDGHEKLPVIVHAEVAEQIWEHDELTLYKELSGVRLGVVGTNAIGANTFRDEHTTLVPEAGIGVRVSQSSAGYTGLGASALPGFRVAALNPDASSRSTMWRDPSEYDGVAHIQGDWGKMGSTPVDANWLNTVFGNEGTRYGIIRVTKDALDDEPEQVKYYAIGAAFEGREDNWHVKGKIAEVRPNECLALDAPLLELGSKAVTGAVMDPSKLHGELIRPATVDQLSIGYLSTAYAQMNANRNTRYSDARAASNVEDFARLGIDLVLESAKINPTMLVGTEAMVDELGRIARLFTTAPRNGRDGYLNALEDEDSARVTYLEAIKELIEPYHVQSSNDLDRRHGNDHGRTFALLAQQSLEILRTAFEEGTLILDAESELVARLAITIDRDQQVTDSIHKERAVALENTVLNEKWERQGIEFRTIIPGTKAEIQLGVGAPLLTGEQTYHAFYTADGHGNVNGFKYPTVAALQINGKMYAIVDARNVTEHTYSHSSSKSGQSNANNLRNRRPEPTFYMLAVIDGSEQARYGIKVKSVDLSFGGYRTNGIAEVRDLTDKTEEDYWKKALTGVTIEYDPYADKLIIMKKEGSFDITGQKEAIKAPQMQPRDRADLATRRKWRDWEDTKNSVTSSIEKLRKRLEQELAKAQESQEMTQDQIDREQARIESIVNRGMHNSWTYNGTRGDTWGRSQSYYLTVDDEGTIWADYEKVNIRHGDEFLTGKPAAPGKRPYLRKPGAEPKPGSIFEQDGWS